MGAHTLRDRRRAVDSSLAPAPPSLTHTGTWRVVLLALAVVLVGAAAVSRELCDDAAPRSQTAPAPGQSTTASSGNSLGRPVDVSWQPLAGMPLPVSVIDGPRCGDDRTASCFSRTRRGAALAAAHLVVRTFPFTGPDVFEPTIAAQVIGGHRGALLRLTREAYRQAAEAAGVTAGAALPVASTDAVAGYRVTRQTPDGTATLTAVTVDLLVRQTDDGGAPAFTAFTVELRWTGGDWRLVAPAWGDWRAAATTVRAPGGDFVPYDPGAGALR